MTPEEAEEREGSGDLQGAFSIWEHIAEEERSPAFFCRAGSVACDLNHWNQAEQMYEAALQIDPRFVIALESLGQLWIEREDFDRTECLQKAKAYFQKALREERNERVLTSLGAVYTYLDQPNDARLMFEEALRANPNYEEAMFNLAENIGTKDREKSITLLNRAIEIDPGYGDAHRELGVHLVRSRDLLNAEYHLRRALELNPSDYWAHMHLANLFGIEGKNVEAEQIYRFATDLHPEITDGIEVFARFLESIGKVDQAARIRAGGPSGPVKR